MKIMSILLCCLFLAGCSSPASSPSTAPVTTTPQELLTVFSPNDNADGFEQTVVEVPAITDASIVEKLVDTGVLAEGTDVNTTMGVSVDSGRETLLADFNTTFLQSILPMGTSGEYVFIGSKVNTYLTAYDADAILITVEGAVLETGHSVYDQPLTFYESFS